jgi:hypothetical protein
MDTFTFFIYFIIFVKFVFIGAKMMEKMVEHQIKNTKNSKEKVKLANQLVQLVYISDRAEFIFIISMSLLLIYIFNPRNPKLTKINTETSVLLFLYGIIVLITAHWDTFFHQPAVLTYIQSILTRQ